MPGGLAGVAAAESSAEPPPARPQAVASDAVLAGHLDWGIKASFRSYVTGPIAQGSIALEGGASTNPDGTFRFQPAGGDADAGAQTVDAAFGGSVRFVGHGGDLDLTFTGLEVQVTGASGVLVADVASKALGEEEITHHDDVELAMLDLAGITPSGLDDTWTWSGVPASLTESGSQAFGEFYEPGTALDPVSFALTLDSPPVWEPAIELSTSVRIDPAGETVTVTGTGFDPGANISTRPPVPPGMPAGIYVMFGRFADTWQPSLGAPSSTRQSIDQKWPLPAASKAAAEAAFGPNPQYVVLAADGSFTTTLNIVPDDTKTGTYGVVTFAAGGAAPNAAQETFTSISFAEPGDAFVATTPTRLLDSRDGTGGFATPWGPGQSRDLVVGGPEPDAGPGDGATSPASVPVEATAVVLNVTGVFPTASTHLTVWPAGGTKPVASNLNLPGGSVRPNLVTVGIGDGGAVSIFNNAGSMHVVADLVGYFVPDTGARHNALAPTRLLDSRDGTGGFATPWGAGQTRDLQVAGGGSPVPTEAEAIIANVTMTGPSAPTHLTIWPAGSSKPVASHLNAGAGQTVANLVVIPVGDGGAVSIFNNAGSAHVLLDVVGYYGADGSTFWPVTPTRLVDSRDGTGGFSTPWGQGQTRTLAVSGDSLVVPDHAVAVVLNVTGVFPTAATHLTVWPEGAKPVASNLNLPAGDVRANAVIVGTDGAVELFNSSGALHVVVDVVGFYTRP